MTDLAKQVDISKQSLSLYANCDNTPPFENVQKIAKALDFPFEYFMTKDLCATETENTYFRSQASASKLMQNAQKIKLEYVAKVYEVLLKYVDFPELNLPTVFFTGADNPLVADSDEIEAQIENCAVGLRSYWGIGMGPIENVQYLLESNGIIVTGFNDVDKRIDAFSQRINVQNNDNIFIVALAIGEKPDVRLRFDMCHELGHVLLHNWDDDNDTLSREEFNALEKQANMFASAFLMPRETFSKDIAPYATNVEYYRTLRKKWGVSIQAMMYRAWQLKLVTPSQFQYMMRTVSAKGWRIHEPGDTPATLNSTLFQSAVDVLFDGDYLNARSMMQAFHEYGIHLSQVDLENIMGLKSGTLNNDAQIIRLIKPKSDI